MKVDIQTVVLLFQYGQVSVLDGQRLKPAQSFVMTPEVGKLLKFFLLGYNTWSIPLKVKVIKKFASNLNNHGIYSKLTVKEVQ